MMKPLFLVLFGLIGSAQAQDNLVFGDTLGFGIKPIDVVYRYNPTDSSLVDSISMVLGHDLFSQLEGRTDSTFIGRIPAGDTTMVIPELPPGKHAIGYRGYSLNVAGGKIHWSTDQTPTWTVSYNATDVLLMVAKKGTFIYFYLKKKEGE